jgi:hypothetical protein
MRKTRPAPPLEGLRRQMGRARGQDSRPKNKTDSFIRETYLLGREEARSKAREWFDAWPKQAYWTAVESWRQLPDDRIEFTMRRLPSAD